MGTDSFREVTKVEAQEKRIDYWKAGYETERNMRIALEESIDNVREALGLESTHYQIINQEVADVVDRLAKANEIIDYCEAALECSRMIHGNLLRDAATLVGEHSKNMTELLDDKADVECRAWKKLQKFRGLSIPFAKKKKKEKINA